MAELLNRIQREAELERLVHRMNRELAAELAEYMKTAKSLSDVPEEFWDKVRKSIEDDDSRLALLLLLMFEENANQHASHINSLYGIAVPPALITLAGQAYVKRRLKRIAPGFVKHSKDMARTFIRERKKFAKSVGGDEESPLVKSKFKVSDAIDKIFGKARAKRLADTEANLSQINGGDFAVKRSGVEVIAIWSHSKLRPARHANAAEKPCPVCSPMEGVVAQQWGDLYPGLCHPNCDCGVTWVDRKGNIIGAPHDSDTLQRFRHRLPTGWLVDPLKESAHDVSGEARDKDGKWTSGGSGSTSDSEVDHHVKSAADDWKKNGVKSNAFKDWFGDSKVIDKKGNPLKVFHGTTFEYGSFDTGNKKNGAVLGYGAYFTDNPDRAAAYAGNNEGANTKAVYLAVKNPFVVTGMLTQDEADRIGKVMSEYSDGKNLLTSPRASAVFAKSDKHEAEAFYKQKMQEWKQYGDNINRTKPQVESENGKFIVAYSDSSKHGVPLNASEAFANIMSLYGPDSSTILHKAGFDGVNRGDEWVVFDPKQIKSATGNRGTFDPHSSKINESIDKPKE